MPPIRIAEAYVYPVKGMCGYETSNFLLDSRVGVVGDRHYAIARDVPRTAAPPFWQPKSDFYVGENTSGIVNMIPRYHEGLDQKWLARAMESIGITNYSLIHTGGAFNMTDDPEPYISIGNLASVRALSEFMGLRVDHRRFRMNIWLDNLDPLAELAWVNGSPGTRTVRVDNSGAMLRIEDACMRCAAVDKNPDTGKPDLPVLDGLKRYLTALGYRSRSPSEDVPIMGVLARMVPTHPQEDASVARVKVGDTITLMPE